MGTYKSDGKDLRMTQFTVTTPAGQFRADQDARLLDILRGAGHQVPTDCGGSGVCGKCAVEILSAGGRQTVLSCQYLVREDLTVLTPDRAADILKTAEDPSRIPYGGHYAAVDLGTTGVSAYLRDGDRGFRLNRMNVLRSFGSDVISRVSAIMEQNALRRCSEMLKKQMRDMVLELCRTHGVPVPERICIGGNTIQQHLLAGVDPMPITVYPFTPPTLFRGEDRFLDLGEGLTAELMPCVAGYFGGDLTAGLYGLEDQSADGVSLLIDIGTNGEVALIRGGQVTCCAVASGPAFEGGNLSCGMPGLDGAVDRVFLRDGAPQWTVIGDCAPRGICGSGVIDLTAALLKLGIVDETGRFLPPSETGLSFPGYAEDSDGNGIYTLSDGVFFTARDVRMIQMAKAALAAGIQTLLRESGTQAHEVSRVILAGSFGTLMDPDSVTAIGMLPAVFRNRCVPGGNTCLRGSAMAASLPDSAAELAAIADRCRYIELSLSNEFNESYIENMMFAEV